MFQSMDLNRQMTEAGVPHHLLDLALHVEVAVDVFVALGVALWVQHCIALREKRIWPKLCLEKDDTAVPLFCSTWRGRCRAPPLTKPILNEVLGSRLDVYIYLFCRCEFKPQYF